MHFLCVLWLVLTAFNSSFGHNFKSAYVKSPLKQLVTSNSLRWEYIKKPHDWVKDNRVVLLSEEVAACKGTYKGVAVIGSARRSNGHCYVDFNGSLHILRTKFYILIQRIRASKLDWTPWDIFTKIPSSSVAYDLKTFVARIEDPEKKGLYCFGSLNPNAGLSGEINGFNLHGDRKTQSSTVGAVLVEKEPVRYELRDLIYIERRKKVLNETKVLLGSKTFINAGLYQNEGAWNSIRSVLSYNTSHTYNWGQLWGLITALPSRGPSYHEEKDDFPIHDFEWGLPLTLHSHQLKEVSRVLQAKTASKCVIKALEQSSEIPYRATLLSFYDDGSNSSLKIEGTYMETVLKDVSVDCELPYFIKNGSVAPTTTTTTTTTTVGPTEDPYADNSGIVFKIKNPRHANNNAHVRGGRLYNTHSSTTTRNPLYRFYPPEEEEKETEMGEIHSNRSSTSPYSGNPKTFSLTNASPRSIHQDHLGNNYCYFSLMALLFFTGTPM
ncbi:protein unzipped [Lepeophtheirus salmonis]|uniref:protein unzipped n=1 Tax=Lepeophtheirus salmonis TaxID=72036 RepID=UPI001AE6DA6F|nr:protein unzipped-like [Lepeophtheirus salmonis]